MAALVEVARRRRHELTSRTVIGRADDCELRIEDPLVSPHHAEVVRDDSGGYVVRDLESKRGVYLGSRKVATAMLSHGDELAIGPVRLRFECRAGTQTNDELTRLRAIVELGRMIGDAHDAEHIAECVLATCWQLLPYADRGSVVVYDANSKTPAMTVSRDSRGAPTTFGLSAAVLGQIMADRRPYLCTSVDDDLVLQRSESLAANGARSVVAVPVRAGSQEDAWLGVIVIDATAATAVFTPRDLEVLDTIGRAASAPLHTAMLARHVRTVIDDESQRFARVVAGLPHGVIVLDDRTRCVLANEWVTARVADLGIIERGNPVTTIAGVATTELANQDQRITITTASQRIYSLSWQSTKDGSETIIVVDDVTAQHERQAQAAHLDRVALVGQLAGGIAHDFNNLLHVILMYANMAEESLDESPLRDDVREIGNAARTASNLTRQLLTFSRRDLGVPRVVDVVEVVRGLENILRHTVGDQIGLSIVCKAVRAPVLIDEAQLQQVVLNLIVNARDAVRASSGAIALTISRAVDHDSDIVAIEVTDNGIGMTPQVVARIFEPYFTTKPRGKGTGLGLATVHSIVSEAHGTIAVRSTPNLGTTFRIVLPLRDDHAQAELAEATPPPCGLRVLVVDDDDAIRRVTERILRGAGYQVTSANSAVAARDVLRREPAFDILLTDVVMPGMSGRELAREVDQSRTAVLFMSGYQHELVTGTDHLAKPFDRRVLLDKLHHVLAERAIAAQHSA